MDHFDDHRFENFKMGSSGHSRSHSRNSSISLSISTSIKSTNSLEIVPPKRNSHHRRRSSVSTRHESAELMGVPVPELSPSPSRDSFNIGEKDSIRQRALWALEGKPDASYVKVEIPELSTPESDTQLTFDFPTRPSFPPGTGAGYGSGMASKRDSFKLLGGTLTSKDQLGTLVEEEEEEESDSENQVIAPAPTPLEPMTPITPVSPDIPVVQRARPTGLNLRPLSLTPEALTTAFSSGLPTPGVQTPGSSPRPGLRSLSLLAQPHDDAPKQHTIGHEVPSSPPNPRRPMLNLQISSESLASSATCVSTSTPSTASDDGRVKGLRRSSISYIFSQANSNAGLPTPEMTPTFPERRYSGHSVSSRSSRSSLSSNMELSLGSGEEESPSIPRAAVPSRHRALSASEQHFLFKSHNALLARIQDLERALSIRQRESLATGFTDGSNSRPLSVTSDVSSSTSAEPSDEMFRLVADLKAERDELKRDVEGWRTRVGDLEKQIGVFTKRVDNERREAWVARSRVNLLEVEKTGLLKDMEAKESVIARLTKLVDELDAQKRFLSEESVQLKAQVEQLTAEKADVNEEVLRWRQECETLRLYQDESSLATPTPSVAAKFLNGKKFGLEPLRDSSSSTTDVELEDEFSFKSDDLEDTEESDEENALAGYEDEEEGDYLSTHDSSSSLGSLNDHPRSVSKASIPSSNASHPPLSSFQFPVPTHQSRASLSKTWTFPTQVKAHTTILPSDSVDKFFGCLEDTSSADSSPAVSDSYTYERSKDLFSSALKNIHDDDTPFFFPRGTGSIVPSDSSSLGVLTEEEEEEDVLDVLPTIDANDEDMFGEVGGIKITFTPPQDDRVQPVVQAMSMSPANKEKFIQDDKERMQKFTFGSSQAKPSAVVTPARALPRASTASSIPRATNKYSPSSDPFVTPPKASSPDLGTGSTAIMTTPSKRAGVMHSFIPQPVSPPSSARSLQKSGPIRAAFIRQPQRKPLASANGAFAQNQNTSNAEPDMNARSSPRRSGHTDFSQASYGPRMISVDLEDNTSGDSVLSFVPYNHPHSHSHPHSSSSTVSTPPSSSSFTSFMASPISSLHTFTTMIPLPWSPVSKMSESLVQEAMPDHDQTPTRPAWLAHNTPDRGTPKRRYVSKDFQLQKLKARLDREQISSSKACQKCVDELVFL